MYDEHLTKIFEFQVHLLKNFTFTLTIPLMQN